MAATPKKHKKQKKQPAHKKKSENKVGRDLRKVEGTLKLVEDFLIDESHDIFKIMATPSIVPPEMIERHFAETQSLDEIQNRGSVEVLGKLTPVLEAFYASNRELETRLQGVRGAHSVLVETCFRNDLDREASQKIISLTARLQKCANVLQRRNDVFWALVRSLYPDAGHISISSDREMVEVTLLVDFLGSDLFPDLLVLQQLMDEV